MQKIIQFRNAKICGGGGIRTPGAIACTTVFETAPFDRSGTPPAKGSCPTLNNPVY
jgi:hypothetical protein